MDAEVGDRIASGTASYSGDYSFAVMDEVSISPGSIGGRSDQAHGTLDITIDFGNGSMNGYGESAASGSSIESTLTLIGDVYGVDVLGRADLTYAITPEQTGTLIGDLTGLVGANSILGVIDAHDADTIAAGGFDADRDP